MNYFVQKFIQVKGTTTGNGKTEFSSVSVCVLSLVLTSDASISINEAYSLVKTATT